MRVLLGSYIRRFNSVVAEAVFELGNVYIPAEQEETLAPRESIRAGHEYRANPPCLADLLQVRPETKRNRPVDGMLWAKADPAHVAGGQIAGSCILIGQPGVGSRPCGYTPQHVKYFVRGTRLAITIKPCPAVLARTMQCQA